MLAAFPAAAGPAQVRVALSALSCAGSFGGRAIGAVPPAAVTRHRLRANAERVLCSVLADPAGPGRAAFRPAYLPSLPFRATLPCLPAPWLELAAPLPELRSDLLNENHLPSARSLRERSCFDAFLSCLLSSASEPCSLTEPSTARSGEVLARRIATPTSVQLVDRIKMCPRAPAEPLPFVQTCQSWALVTPSGRLRAQGSVGKPRRPGRRPPEPAVSPAGLALPFVDSASQTPPRLPPYPLPRALSRVS